MSIITRKTRPVGRVASNPGNPCKASNFHLLPPSITCTCRPSMPWGSRWWSRWWWWWSLSRRHHDHDHHCMALSWWPVVPRVPSVSSTCYEYTKLHSLSSSLFHYQHLFHNHHFCNFFCHNHLIIINLSYMRKMEELKYSPTCYELLV